jgi:hypothetical protein
MMGNPAIVPNCPLCGSFGVTGSIEAFGYVAHCSECYEGDPDAPFWAHITGQADTAELAVEEWLETAREYAATDTIPGLRCPSSPEDLFADLSAQISAERERTRGWITDSTGGYGPGIVEQMRAAMVAAGVDPSVPRAW